MELPIIFAGFCHVANMAPHDQAKGQHAMNRSFFSEITGNTGDYLKPNRKM